MRKFLILTLIFAVNRQIVIAFQQDVVPTYSILEKRESITLNHDFSINYKTVQSTSIWDARGLDHASMRLSYDQLTKIENFEATIINPVSGKVIKKVKLKDLKDASMIDSNNLYGDSRIKIFSIGSIQLPVRVDVTVEIKQSGNFFIRRWVPINHYHQKVKTSTLELKYPEKLGIRYKEKNITDTVTQTQAGEFTILKWEEKELAALDIDEGDKDPMVLLAPVHFSMEGYRSTMDSWEGLAKWINQLNSGKDELTPSFKSEVKAMLDGVEDDFEKINILYRYLQKNYRYVSIQLGIGGWRPQLASEVVANKYGECKALTTLMKALLKEADIESQYTLVKAGSDTKQIDVDFPSNQFNHAILRVPLNDEVFWIECTSTTLPPGYLGNFTMGRDVLVITEEGGFMDKTPSYKGLKFNTIHQSYDFELQDNGDGSLKGKNTYSGFAADDYSAITYYLEDKEKRNYLTKNLGGSGLIIGAYDLNTDHVKNVPTAEVTFDGVVQRFTQSTAKRILIPLQWKKLDIGMIQTGTLNWEEDYHFITNKPVENGLPQDEITEEYFSFFLSSSIDETGISVKKKTDRQLS